MLLVSCSFVCSSAATGFVCSLSWFCTDSLENEHLKSEVDLGNIVTFGFDPRVSIAGYMQETQQLTCM